MRPYLFVKYTMQTENRLLYVSLGANIGRREESIRRAVAMMEKKNRVVRGMLALLRNRAAGLCLAP